MRGIYVSTVPIAARAGFPVTNSKSDTNIVLCSKYKVTEHYLKKVVDQKAVL